MFSNFKHFQKSPCTLADRHCLQATPALHKSFWLKKENICNGKPKKLEHFRSQKSSITFIIVSYYNKYKEKGTLVTPGAGDRQTDPFLFQLLQNFFHLSFLHHQLAHYWHFLGSHYHHHSGKVTGQIPNHVLGNETAWNEHVHRKRAKMIQSQREWHWHQNAVGFLCKIEEPLSIAQNVCTDMSAMQ